MSSPHRISYTITTHIARLFSAPMICVVQVDFALIFYVMKSAIRPGQECDKTSSCVSGYLCLVFSKVAEMPYSEAILLCFRPSVHEQNQGFPSPGAQESSCLARSPSCAVQRDIVQGNEFIGCLDCYRPLQLRLSV